MKALPLRMQVGLVGLIYAGVVMIAAMLAFSRYMLYVRHPQDAAAAGGMYAAGDWMLEIFIGCMLLVPTFLLALVLRNHENLYTNFSKVLLGLSVTAPISLGVISIPAVSQSNMLIGWICMDRLFCSPVVLLALVGGRLLARFDLAKRLASYALLVEILTLVLAVGLSFF
jgi:hypothetical protein